MNCCQACLKGHEKRLDGNADQALNVLAVLNDYLYSCTRIQRIVDNVNLKRGTVPKKNVEPKDMKSLPVKLEDYSSERMIQDDDDTDKSAKTSDKDGKDNNKGKKKIIKK